ncbi:MAG: hypothetical protein IGS03_02175 [Candidatus Sericytochromatia bacterium]|nr:hypothetical protein [Candidatus Sericytochromatia bacterium]
MSAPSQPSEELKQLLGQSLRLRQDLIQRVIARDFEGNASAFGRSLELQAQPHHKTVLRWARQQQGLPKSPQRLLALAQALDVDPFLLLQFDPALVLQACRQASWNLSWGSIHKALAILNGLLALTPEAWPPPELAEGFDGEWYCEDFVHDPRAGRHFFQAFEVLPEHFYAPEGHFEAARDPQLWYLAYRDISLKQDEPEPLSYWRPFGLIWTENQRLQLLQFSGLQDAAELNPDCRFAFEVFFGQGAAMFRMASLHPFELQRVSDTAADLPRVRFGFPE